jgi:hypothetical protein
MPSRQSVLWAEGECPLCHVELQVHHDRGCCPCCGDSYRVATDWLEVMQCPEHGRHWLIVVMAEADASLGLIPNLGS